jgi:hypothetical protein
MEMPMKKIGQQFLTIFIVTAAFLINVQAQQPGQGSANWPTPREGDFVIHDFHFQSGESLPELRMHYTTLGAPIKDSTGRTTNAAACGLTNISP